MASFKIGEDVVIEEENFKFPTSSNPLLTFSLNSWKSFKKMQVLKELNFFLEN